jgi:hypothetical protein
MLRVFGRLPFTDVMRFSEAGVRKASREETAGKFAPTVVSVYGDLASFGFEQRPGLSNHRSVGFGLGVRDRNGGLVVSG